MNQMRRFFWAPKTYVKTDGLKNIYNFTLKILVYLNLCLFAGKVCVTINHDDDEADIT